TTSSLGIATFAGQAVDPASIVILYTLAGDANLDGAVNALDFNALASNFGGAASVWVNGDLNYDGVVNSLDFNSIAANFGQQMALPAPVMGMVIPEPTGAL